MAIRRRGAGWQADIYHQGTRYRETFRTEQEARAWEAEKRQALHNGRAMPEPHRGAAATAWDGELSTVSTSNLFSELSKRFLEPKTKETQVSEPNIAPRGEPSPRGKPSPSGKLTREELGALTRLLEVLKILLKEKDTMQVLMAATLFRVALRPGKSVQELTNEADLSQSSMSRLLLDLGPKNRKHEPGLGLVEHKLSPVNMRSKEVYLTKRGKDLVSNIFFKLYSEQRDLHYSTARRTADRLSQVENSGGVRH